MRTCGTEWVDREPRVDSITGLFGLRADTVRVCSTVGPSTQSPTPVVISQQRSRHGRSLLKGPQVTASISFYNSPGQNRTFVRATAGDAPRQCNNRRLTALSCGRTFLASAVMATLAACDSSARKITRRRRGSADCWRFVPQKRRH